MNSKSGLIAFPILLALFIVSIGIFVAVEVVKPQKSNPTTNSSIISKTPDTSLSDTNRAQSKSEINSIPVAASLPSSVSGLPKITPDPIKENPPTLNSVSPATGPLGTVITLSGEGFGSGIGSVNFYDQNNRIAGGAAIISWADNEIKAVVPTIAGNKSYQLEVTKFGGGKSEKRNFWVSLEQPQITAILPENAHGEELITLKGKALGSDPGKVIFEKDSVITECPLVGWNRNEIICTLPSSLFSNQTYSVVVQTSDGRSSSKRFYTIGQ